MKFAVRLFVLGLMVSMYFATPAAAQYMRITTDNPGDNTRLRASGTTILTIMLDTNHDKDASLQSCNSHSVLCGAPATAQPLEMFSYTLDLAAVGGTVQWGTFTAADAAYTPIGADLADDQSTEINRGRPAGTFTPPGLSTLGTLPVTILTGAPRVDVARGPISVNPAAFGSGFGTTCDGFQFLNTYVIGDPNDRCGTVSGLGPGDWFDADGALAPAGLNTPPVLAQPANMTVNEGATADQSISATDSDGQPLTFAKVSGPAFVTVTTTSAGTGTAAGNINVAPGFSDDGSVSVTVSVSDGAASVSASLSVTVVNVNQAPVLAPPANMTVTEGTTANQEVTAADGDGNPITFSKVSGPAYFSVTTTDAGTGTASGNIRLAPISGDAGTESGVVRASDGTLNDDETFSITVTPGAPTNEAPTLTQPADMTVTEGATADQTLNATDPDGDPLAFTKATGPTFLTVTTTSPGTGTATGNAHVAPVTGDTVGSPHGASVTVTDGGLLTDTESFSITVNPAAPGNEAPTLTQPADMTVTEGATA
ncbi:MAG TPA: Ig-like domain-containing protein, partial [Candidatus Eisenbacteria bacterium]